MQAGFFIALLRELLVTFDQLDPLTAGADGQADTAAVVGRFFNHPWLAGPFAFKRIKALKNEAKSEEVHIEALELLNELLKKLGSTFPNYHQGAMEVIVDKLNSCIALR